MSELNNLDTAWKIHQAQSDWTGRVDAKASFIFALSSAAVATTVTLSAKGRVFHNLPEQWLQWMFWAGLALLALGVYLSSRVVIPRLRASKMRSEYKANFIYFGHLQHWSASDLEAALREQDPLPVISSQIVAMAKIAWKKHRFAQWALRCGIAGAALEALVALAVTTGC